MIYINQKKYPDMPYLHNAAAGGAGENNNIAFGGCGLCCMCMVVENMTFNQLSLEECRDLSEAVKANQELGTDLKILGPAVAEKYGMTYGKTDDIEEVKKCLAAGGQVVANSGGDREGWVGLLTHGGHYVTVVSYDKGEFCILDPSWTPEKFHEEGREGKVREAYPFIYVKEADLVKDCDNRFPPFYLFRRISD